MLKRSIFTTFHIPYSRIRLAGLDVNALADKTLIIFNARISHDLEAIKRLHQLKDVNETVRVVVRYPLYGHNVNLIKIGQMVVAVYRILAGEKRDYNLILELGTESQKTLLDEHEGFPSCFEALIVDAYKRGNVSSVIEITFC